MAERSWLHHVANELEVSPDMPVEKLLDAARVVAHSVERKATPLTTYLIGVAAAGSGDADAACRRVIQLAQDWDTGEDQDADSPGG